MIGSRLIVLPMCFGLSCGMPRPAGPPATRAADAHTQLALATQALIDSAGVPGLALALVANGRIVWAQGSGVRTTAAAATIDTTTVFEAASLSKPVFAYAVLKLVDEGRLNLDAPLAAVLPDSELAGDPRASRITARMVLSHTTGLPNERHPGERLALQFDPGTRFAYSGEGFTYLQHVVEAIVHVPLDRFMREAVFLPLHMARSSYVWESRFSDDVAVGHDEYGRPLPQTRPAAARAPSSLHTTVSDYARFLIAVLSGVELSPASRRAILQAQVAVAPQIDWGLGWALQRTDSGSVLWHWGDNSNSGYTAYVQGDPVRRTGFVFLTNSTVGLSLSAALIRRLSGSTEPAVAFMHYEQFDAPARRLRVELERRIRSFGVLAGLAYFDSAERSMPGGVPENVLNRLGYRFLALGRPADAVAIFRRNAEQYPASANVYDSLGEGLAAAGDTAAAIQSYRRSLTLDPNNANAVAMLRRLGATP